MRIDWDRYLPREERRLAVQLAVGALLVSWSAGLLEQLTFLGQPAEWLATAPGAVAILGASTLIAFTVLALLLRRARFPRSLWLVVALSAALTAVTGILTRLAGDVVFNALSHGQYRQFALSTGIPSLVLARLQSALPEVVAGLLAVALVLRMPAGESPAAEATALPDPSSEDDEDGTLVDWSALARRLRLPTADYAFPPHERPLALWIAAMPALLQLAGFVTGMPANWAQIRELTTFADAGGGSWATTVSGVVGYALASFVVTYVVIRAFRAPRSVWLALSVTALAGIVLTPLSGVSALVNGMSLGEFASEIVLSLVIGAALAVTPLVAVVAAVRMRVGVVLAATLVAVAVVLSPIVVPAPSRLAASGLQFQEAVSKAFPGFGSDAEAQPAEATSAPDESGQPTSWAFFIDRAGVTRAIYASDLEMEEDGNEYLPVKTAGKDVFVRDDYFIDLPESRFAKTPYEQRRALWDAVARDTSGKAPALPRQTSEEFEDVPRQRSILAVFADPRAVPTADLAAFGYDRERLANAVIVSWTDYANEELADIGGTESGIRGAADYIGQLNEGSFGPRAADGYRYGVLAYRWVSGGWQRIEPTKAPGR